MSNFDLSTNNKLDNLITHLLQHAQQCYPTATISSELALVAHPESMFVRLYHMSLATTQTPDGVRGLDVAVTVLLTETWTTRGGKSEVGFRSLDEVLEEYNRLTSICHTTGLFPGVWPQMRKRVSWVPSEVVKDEDSAKERAPDPKSSKATPRARKVRR